jgi:hypothetical protein
MLVAFAAAASDAPPADKAVPAAKPAPARVMAPAGPALLQRLADNMKTMQQQMDQLDAATDEAQRARLLADHRKSMEEQMRLMQNLVGRGPMATGMGPGSPLDRRLSLLEQRMELMQQMMSQLLKHQEQSPGAAGAK